MVAEVIATYLLVFVTCGSAALSASDEQRVSKLGASVAGGLIVTAMIYAVGHISGAHMNPAVTLAFAAVRHFPWKQVTVFLQLPQLPISNVRLGRRFILDFIICKCVMTNHALVSCIAGHTSCVGSVQTDFVGPTH